MDSQLTARQSGERPFVELAKTADLPPIKAMIDAAYSKYIEPMGMIPAAMKVQYDYKLVETQSVYVLRIGDELVGSIILGRDKDAITVNNLVISPQHQGRGYGRLLMQFAEAQALQRGLVAVTLYTNEKMYDNLVLYSKLGFTETGRRTEDGFKRVYFRKSLR